MRTANMRETIAWLQRAGFMCSGDNSCAVCATPALPHNDATRPVVGRLTSMTMHPSRAIESLSLDERTELSRGFSAGNYCNAYETDDLDTALSWLDAECDDETDDDYSEAYRAAFVVGFFATYALHEIPGSDRETFDEMFWSRYGQACLAAGYCDDRTADYQSESEGL